MNNNASSAINDRLTIIKKLSTLANHNCVISANIGKGEHLLTSILAINIEDSTLVLECGAFEQLNQKMVLMPSVRFSTVFRDTHVAFAGSVKKITLKGRSVFLMYIPGLLYWHNRRKHSRVKIQTDKPSFCDIVLPIPKPDSPEEYKQNYTIVTDKIRRKLLEKFESESNSSVRENEILINLIQLELNDISQSGCSMLNYYEEFSYFLMPSTIYENCTIIMPNRDRIDVSFQIMSKRNIQLNESTELKKCNELIGVRFTKVVM